MVVPVLLIILLSGLGIILAAQSFPGSPEIIKMRVYERKTMRCRNYIKKIANFYNRFSYKCFVFSADAWVGLTKPVPTWAREIQDCVIKCNNLKAECGLLQYNETNKDCSTAKVASPLLTTHVIHCQLSSSRLTVSGMCTG